MEKTSITYGYARVSTAHQNEERQLVKLKDYGIDPDNIYTDHITGKSFNRPGYAKMLQNLRPEDVVVVTSLDRLGRSYTEIPEQWKILTKEKKVEIVVLDMPILNTKDRTDDLMKTFVSDLILGILSYTADIERKMNHQRTMDGIAAAKARGVKFGKKPLVVPDEFPQVYKLWESGELSANKASQRLGVSRNTFLKWARSVVSSGC
ncbi:MAG: recombinase family protein [Lachnospiraceae bacterium]|nr:recombinase family protein [Lachnospiraceae bacterium]